MAVNQISLVAAEMGQESITTRTVLPGLTHIVSISRKRWSVGAWGTPLTAQSHANNRCKDLLTPVFLVRLLFFRVQAISTLPA